MKDSFRFPIRPAILFSLLLAIVTAPLAADSSPAQPDTARVWYLEQEAEEVLTLSGEGNTAGEILLSSGTLRQTPDGPSLGRYTRRTLTASVAIPGGRLHEDTALALQTSEGTILAASLVTGNAGTPPRKETLHPIIGGTGTYSGLRGELVLTPLSPTSTRVHLVVAE